MSFNEFVHEIPRPSAQSLILVCGTAFFGYLASLTHDDVNKWLATIAGMCALISYGYKLYKFLKRR